MRPPISQLDSAVAALRGSGCMIFTLEWLIDWATDGKGIANDRASLDKAGNTLVRKAGMTPAEFLRRGTTLDEAEQAYESFNVPDYLPLTMRKLHGGSLRDDVIPALHDGMAAAVCINYGVFQDAHKASPSSSFRGGHAIAVLESGTPGKLTVIDPLRHDVVELPVALVEHAMETFGSNPWGNGRGEVGIVTKKQTWQEAYTAAAANLKDAKASLAAVRSNLSDAKDQIGKLQTEAAKLKDERDAAKAAERVAEQSVADLGAQLNTAKTRIAELEAGCAPLVDAARAEGRIAMRDEIILDISGRV